MISNVPDVLNLSATCGHNCKTYSIPRYYFKDQRHSATFDSIKYLGCAFTACYRYLQTLNEFFHCYVVHANASDRVNEQ